MIDLAHRVRRGIVQIFLVTRLAPINQECVKVRSTLQTFKICMGSGDSEAASVCLDIRGLCGAGDIPPHEFDSDVRRPSPHIASVGLR